MNLVSALNAIAESWSAWMWFALADGALLLVLTGLVWLTVRRRASAQFGYLLFLLVLVPLVVPVPLSVPVSLAWLSPHYAAERWTAWLDDYRSGRGTLPTYERHDSSAEHAAAEKRARTSSTTAHADLLPRAQAASTSPDETSPTLSLRAVLMLGWSLVVTALIARFAWVQWWMARRLTTAEPLDSKALAVNLAELRERLRLRREVPLVTSASIGSPSVWGLWRPRLILPPELANQLPREQLAWVLSHELAHVRRGDLWIVLAQKLVQIVYFFHPAVWLANRLIDRQRECACDDAALAVAGCSGRQCGAALVAVVERSCGLPPVPALGLFHSQAFLRRRIMRLVEQHRAAPPRLSRLSLVFLALLAAMVLPRVSATQVPVARKVFAQSTDQAADGEPGSDLLALADEPAREGDRGVEPAGDAPSPAEREAALQAIQNADGHVYPDIDKLIAAGDKRGFSDPTHDFLGVGFSGTVTDDLLANLANFPEIERANFSGAVIPDTALVRLKVLRKLRRLDLNRSSISDVGLVHLGQLRELRALGLSGTGITDAGLAYVADLRRLESLSLDGTAITGQSLTHLKGLVNLQDLTLKGTKIDDAGLAYLARLPKLRELRLNDTKIGDAGLAHLRNTTSLSSIDLSGTQVTDAGMGHLAGLTKLRALALQHTRVGDAGFEQLKSMSTFTDLSLGDTQISDVTLAMIGRCADLLGVDLSGTKVTDAGVAQLAGLSKLTQLKLDHTGVNDLGLEALAACKEVRLLNLAGTAVTDAGLAHLKPLVALEYLDLSGTRISDPRLEPLNALPALRGVNIDGTAVTAFDKLRALPMTNPHLQKVFAALDDLTELDFTKQTLSDVVEYLKSRHDIEIGFDFKSLAKQGIKTNSPNITAKLDRITLRKALDAILDPLGLTIGIRHEVLLIAAKPFPETSLDLPDVPAGERLSPKLAAALVQNSEFDFTDQPLSDVVEFLKAQHGIEIRFDGKALADARIGSDTPITMAHKGLTLKSMLELLLGEHDLTCVAVGDALVIGPRKDKKEE